MRCPRCVQKIHLAATSCPHCGFTVEQADELFGDQDVSLQKFSDPAGAMRMKERKPMRKLMERFEKRFPQLFVSVYLGAFEEMTSIRQFGFWLLNRAAFSDVDVNRPNENGILIVVDVTAKTAGVTYGYSLLPYLDDESTFNALSAAHPYLIQGEFLQAIDLTIRKLETTLKKGWRRAKRNPEKVLGEIGQNPVARTKASLKGVRVGNRVSETREKVEVEE